MPFSRMIACARAMRFNRSSTPIGGTSPRIEVIAASSLSAVEPPTPIVISISFPLTEYARHLGLQRKLHQVLADDDHAVIDARHLGHHFFPDARLIELIIDVRGDKAARSCGRSGFRRLQMTTRA